MSKFEQIIYEPVEAGIVRIILNRPEARNAQDTRMLYELNDALDEACGCQPASVSSLVGYIVSVDVA